jgi:bleomycin hydrolase
MKISVKTFLLLLVVSFSIPAQPIKEKLEKALGNLPHPQSVEDFTALPHLPSMNQDSTLICWSFATSSFIESEMQRIGRDPVRLSVMFPVYHVFNEKVKRFVQTKGESHFGPGDLFGGVFNIGQQYGTMPIEVYEGSKTLGIEYNHNALYSELEILLNKIKAQHIWDEGKALELIKPVLNKYLGTPPDSFIYKGKTYTPKLFASQVINLSWNEYIIVTSFQYAPFYQFIELKVPDNWKHDSNFFNVPLPDFYRSITSAVKNGFTAAIDMDNSEPSYRLTKQYAFIPEYEVPKDSVSQSKRERQFQSGATTDDHLMQIVSYRNFGEEDWFLAKDSWRTAWEGENHGYFFLHESYVKLKVLAFLVHRDGVPDISKLVPKTR